MAIIYNMPSSVSDSVRCTEVKAWPVYMQEQVTSSSHTARKQPGRASKRSSQNETDIPIEGDVGPSVHVSEVAQDEAGQMGPAFMSTQDYLEEAEDLLNHPLEPNPLDTQPEVGHAE